MAKAYRELEHGGLIELRQGAGAFVSEKAPSKKDAERFRAAQAAVATTIEKLRAQGVANDDIRRLFEAELAGMTKSGGPSFARATEGERGE